MAPDRVMESREVTNKQTAPPEHSLAEHFLNVQGHVYFLMTVQSRPKVFPFPSGRLDGAVVLWVWLTQG